MVNRAGREFPLKLIIDRYLIRISSIYNIKSGENALAAIQRKVVPDPASLLQTATGISEVLSKGQGVIKLVTKQVANRSYFSIIDIPTRITRPKT